MKFASNLVLPCLILSVVSCGAGQAVRPDDPTYKGATGEKPSDAICHDVTADGAPLVVDWRPEERGDLEVAMKSGIAVVHYDCNTIKLLTDCSLRDHTYGYVGMTKKEQVINLTNQDEAKANLPLQGGQIGGQLERGSSLDIGLVMVGKSTALVDEVKRGDLKGRCDGATHYVRTATVGAYAMKTNTSGSVSSAAQLFSVGASAGSQSKKNVNLTDGDVAACDQADPDAKVAPKRCKSPLRLQLVAIDGAATSDIGGLKCPAGTTAANGKCTASADENAKKCQGKDAPACEASCKQDNVDSCSKWGDLMINKALGEKSTDYDVPMAEAFSRGCKLGDDELCAMLATNYAAGRGVPRDGAKAIRLAQAACQAGAAVGCAVVAGVYDKGMGVPADRVRGTHLYERACQAGSSIGCIAAAQAYAGGLPGIPQDQAHAVTLFDSACDAGEAWGCVHAGRAYRDGVGVTANPDIAASFFRRGCSKELKEACVEQKRLGR